MKTNLFNQIIVYPLAIGNWQLLLQSVSIFLRKVSGTITLVNDFGCFIELLS